MSKRTIHFLSASDRINYGDLLFPIICKKLAEEKKIEFRNYAIIKSDLSHFGALHTSSYKSFLYDLKSKNSNVVIGGGEVLFASWETLWGNISLNYKQFRKIKILRKIDQRLRISHVFFFQTKNRFPFIINAEQKHLIFYNAIGGSYEGNLNLEYFKDIFSNLKSARFISVRDIKTKKNLAQKNIKSKLCPDSALLLSDLFTKEYLKIISDPHTDILSKPYLFFQMGKHFAPDDIEKLSRDLIYIGEELNVNVVLCPIGLAIGHEDDFLLRKLSLLSSKLIYYSPKNLFDIVRLISMSKVYIGTSLHGLITAQSYGVPFVSMNKNVKKADYYCKTWTKKNIESSISFDNIKQSIKYVQEWDFEAANKNLRVQKELVYKNFDTIFSQLI